MKISYKWLKELSGSPMGHSEMAQSLTFAGLEVVSMEVSEGNCVFEAEITSNRSDWLSMLGIAREICAIERRPAPDLAKISKRPAEIKEGKPNISVRVDKGCCEFYMAVEIKGVKIAPSPKWLADALEQSGIRPINNVVDITNYCMLLFGQPLHAFDADKIRGGIIYVRNAGKDERIVALDGEERRLSEQDIVIADAEKPIAIAGVIGGENSEVSSSTVNIILESARFPRISIRKTRQRLGINTEASYRFERDIDPMAVELAALHACAMIEELAGGKAIGIGKAGRLNIPAPKIEVSAKDVAEISAIDVPANEIKAILSGLGFSIEQRQDSFIVTVPSFRLDIKIKEDIIEEILRIYGYDNVPVEYPAIGKNTIRGIFDKRVEFLRQVHCLLQKAGAYEAVSFSLISEKEAKAFYKDVSLLFVSNTISRDYKFLRLGPVPGLLGSLARNINRGYEDVFLYEIGQSLSKDALDKESLMLGVCVSSKKAQDAYKKIKSVIDLIAKEITNTPINISAQRRDGVMDLSGFGAAGLVDEEVKKAYGIKNPAAFLCINLEKIYDVWKNRDRKYVPLPAFPAVEFDISMWVDINKINYQEIVRVIQENGGGNLEEIKLVDVYKDKTRPGISYAFRLFFRNKERTLTSGEAGKDYGVILKELAKREGIELRTQ